MWWIGTKMTFVIWVGNKCYISYLEVMKFKQKKTTLDCKVVFDLYKFSACAEKTLLLDHFVTTFNEIG